MLKKLERKNAVKFKYIFNLFFLFSIKIKINLKIVYVQIKYFKIIFKLFFEFINNILLKIFFKNVTKSTSNFIWNF